MLAIKAFIMALLCCHFGRLEWLEPKQHQATHSNAGPPISPCMVPMAAPFANLTCTVQHIFFAPKTMSLVVGCPFGEIKHRKLQAVSDPILTICFISQWTYPKIWVLPGSLSHTQPLKSSPLGSTYSCNIPPFGGPNDHHLAPSCTILHPLNPELHCSLHHILSYTSDKWRAWATAGSCTAALCWKIALLASSIPRIHEQWSVSNLHGQWQLFHCSSSFWDTGSILPAEQLTRKWIIYRTRQWIFGSSSSGTKWSDQNHQQMSTR